MRWVHLVLLAAAAHTGCLSDPDFDISKGADLHPDNTDTVAGWYRFTEGPTRDATGNVYFSDLVTKRIYRWNTDDEVEVIRDNGEMTNGLAVGPDGRVYACEPYQRRVIALGDDARSDVLAQTFGDHRFNSPNDVWVAPNGGVYFTDPRYTPERVMEQDGEHVYFVPPAHGSPVRVLSDLVKPNGIVGTSDGRHLFVADDGANRTYRYDIAKDGTLSNRIVAADTGSDGLTLDVAGRLYVVGETVGIYDSSAKKIGTIDTPFFPTNVTFGGIDADILFITGKWVVHKIKMNTKGDIVRPSSTATTTGR